jgi:hypothetical protein
MLRIHVKETYDAKPNPVPVPFYGLAAREGLFLVPQLCREAYIEPLTFEWADLNIVVPCGQSYNAPCPYCEV